MKCESNDKLEAQLTKYFQKVIHNAAINYYKGKSKFYDKEIMNEPMLHSLLGITNMEKEIHSKVFIEKYYLVVQDEKLNEVIVNLNNKEQKFILEKHILGKTDQEIAEIFGISRQGVTNFKKRLYEKLKKEITNLK
ncbi:sigma-70 family RNA polymerase sigma factor [Enterococcus faecalis]|uniref:sigma-70 family RNA polymerase sigma factor n=1 Tax=Enterococcus faecalis TaxID=1351 RepID=UPI00189AB5DB|nr:sigma-70 family RNA polymerase sigma factor [Enterococcus faecalis]